MSDLRAKEQSILLAACGISILMIGIALGSISEYGRWADGLRQWGTILLTAGGLIFAADQLVRTRRQLSINVDQYRSDRLASLSERAKAQITVENQYDSLALSIEGYISRLLKRLENDRYFEVSDHVNYLRDAIRLDCHNIKMDCIASQNIIDPAVYIISIRVKELSDLCSRDMQLSCEIIRDIMLKDEINKREISRSQNLNDFLARSADLIVALEHAKDQVVDMRQKLSMRALLASSDYEAEFIRLHPNL